MICDWIRRFCAFICPQSAKSAPPAEESAVQQKKAEPDDKPTIQSQDPTQQNQIGQCDPNVIARATTPNIFHVDNRDELQAALRTMLTGDTIVINESGDYGQIRITAKHNIRVKAASLDLVIQGSIYIDGGSSDVRIEGMNIHCADKPHYIIFCGQNSSEITIQHNIISTSAVKTDSLHDQFIGEPSQWLSGIRILSPNSTVFNNKLVNLRIGIIAEATGTLVVNNLLRFFSEDAIRVQNHGITIDSNQIEDAVMANKADPAHQDAIQLIPPVDRYKGGQLERSKIIANRISNRSRADRVPDDSAAILQGIFGSDGYFVDCTIRDNQLRINSDHGITLNGVKNLELKRNQISKSPETKPNYIPGIKFYFTRIGGGNNDSYWREDLDYSVNYLANQAEVFNLPDENYQGIDQGDNQFGEVTGQCER